MPDNMTHGWRPSKIRKSLSVGELLGQQPLYLAGAISVADDVSRQFHDGLLGLEDLSFLNVG